MYVGSMHCKDPVQLHARPGPRTADVHDPCCIFWAHEHLTLDPSRSFWNLLSSLEGAYSARLDAGANRARPVLPKSMVKRKGIEASDVPKQRQVGFPDASESSESRPSSAFICP